MYHAISTLERLKTRLPIAFFSIGGVVALMPLFGLPLATLPPKTHDILMVVLSIVIEATPFLLIGSLASAFVRRSTIVENIIRIFPKNPIIGLPFASLLGVFLPICECGNVPIARSLVVRGLPKAYATTFLFSAPILNPAVFFSTYIAFRGEWLFFAERFLFGFLIALALGVFVLWQEKYGESLWKKNLKHESAHSHSAHASQGCENHGAHQTKMGGALTDFFEILPLLAFGALATSLFQAFVPRELFFEGAISSVSAILLMMALAFVLSVCSSADAFIALGYSGLVPPSALLAFLVFGPMIDAKNILIYGKIFTISGIIRISTVTALLVLISALLTEKVPFL